MILIIVSIFEAYNESLLDNFLSLFCHLIILEYHYGIGSTLVQIGLKSIFYFSQNYLILHLKTYSTIVCKLGVLSWPFAFRRFSFPGKTTEAKRSKCAKKVNSRFQVNDRVFPL